MLAQMKVCSQGLSWRTDKKIPNGVSWLTDKETAQMESVPRLISKSSNRAQGGGLIRMPSAFDRMPLKKSFAENMRTCEHAYFPKAAGALDTLGRGGPRRAKA